MFGYQPQAVNAAAINAALSVVGTQLFANGHLFAGSSYNIGWASRSLLSAPSDGTVRATNAAGTAFTMFQFGGGTSSFVGLKPVSTTLQVRLADDSAAASLRVLALTVDSGTNLITSTAAFGNGAAAATGTLTNAPAPGNPTKWIPISDNGTTRYIPAW
jgi:hypothetical protein